VHGARSHSGGAGALARRRAPGGQVTATVSWRVPNFFGGLLHLFGVGSGDVISGQAVAVFRKEGDRLLKTT